MNDLKTPEVRQRSGTVAQITMSRRGIFNAFGGSMIGQSAPAFDKLVNDAEEAREAVPALLDKRRYNR